MATRHVDRSQQKKKTNSAMPRKVKKINQSIDVGAAFQKPVWHNEQEIQERPLWHIAALAGDLSPNSKSVGARRRIDAAWEEGYLTLLKVMVHALSTVRSNAHILYAKDKPINISFVANRSKLKFMLVDVASACSFLANKYGAKNLPLGLQRMHEHLQVLVTMPASMPLQSPLQPANLIASEKSTAHRDQTKGNESKKTDQLSMILYAIVKGEFGYDPNNRITKNSTLEIIEKHFDLFNIKGRRGLSPAAVANILEYGASLMPLPKHE